MVRIAPASSALFIAASTISLADGALQYEVISQQYLRRLVHYDNIALNAI